MGVGDIALYWPAWGPAKPHSESEPEGHCLILAWDEDESAYLEGKPSRPQWEILFNGRRLWVNMWQVQEGISESR